MYSLYKMWHDIAKKIDKNSLKISEKNSNLYMSKFTHSFEQKNVYSKH